MRFLRELADHDRWASWILLTTELLLFPASLEYLIVVIDADVRLIGRDREDGELVDVVKLSGFGFRSSGHTGKFFVEAEVVLNGDGGVGLCFLFHVCTLLGFNGLVEAIRPAATWHFTASVFINDDDFVVSDDIFDIFFVETVSLEQLGNRVHLLSLSVEALLESIFFLGTIFVAEVEINIDLSVGSS